MLHGFPHLSSVLDALPHPHASFLACGSLDIKDAHGQSLCDWTGLSNDTLSSFWRSLVHFPPSSSHQKRRAIISPFNHCRSRSRPLTHMLSSSYLLCLPLFFLSHLSSQTNQGHLSHSITSLGSLVQLELLSNKPVYPVISCIKSVYATSIHPFLSIHLCTTPKELKIAKEGELLYISSPESN